MSAGGRLNEQLLDAARHGQTKVVKALLAQRGVDAAAADKYKQNALHMAAIDGHVAITKLLLAKGVDVNARSTEGETPLLMGARCSAGVDWFELVLAHGADVSVRTKEGKTAMDAVFHATPIVKARIPVGKLLAAHGAATTPAQKRVVSGARQAALKGKIAAFDWGALEAHLLAASTKALAAFAKRHRDEVFCAFCFDCNAQMHGQVLLCLNTPAGLARAIERYGDDRRERLAWGPGNWAHQELHDLDSDKGWRARVARLGDEDGIELEPAARLLESIARVAVRLEAAGAFAPLQRTDDFFVFVRDHDETIDDARARMKRARAAAGTKGASKAKATAAKPAPRAQPGSTDKRRFELRGGGSNKFWQIEVTGAGHVVTFGRIGSAGQRKEKKLASPAAARADADKLVKEKTGKGYKPVKARS